MTPLETIEKLGQKLDESRSTLDLLDRYMTGTQAVAWLPSEVREAVGSRLFAMRAPFPSLIVQAVAERLAVDGFRVADDAPADADLWAIWRRNQLDEASALAHQAALRHGRAAVTVWADGRGAPLIRVESARQMALDIDPATGEVRAAFKAWVDSGTAFAVVHQADAIHKFTADAPADGCPPLAASSWRTRGEVIANPLGVVPVVPIVNRPSLGAPEGESEISAALPLVDLIDKLYTDAAVASEYHSMPRRWATGIQVVEDDDGEPISPFSSVAGRVWLSEDPESRFGQFAEADLSGYLDAIRLAVEHLASLTSTPAHYIAHNLGALASAESIRAAEAPLVAKTRARQRTFGAAWESVMALAVHVRDGRPSPAMEGVECLWRDPESFSPAVLADSALKRATLGVPWPQLMADLGYSPEEVERMRRDRRTDAIDAAGIDLAALLDAGA